MKPGRIWQIVAACAAVVAAPGLGEAAATPPRLEVEVEGVKGEVEENVLAHLTIAARRKDGLSEAEIRDLDTRAPHEIELGLQPFGFYRPVITSETVHHGDRLTIRYVIATGPPLPIDSLDVEVFGPGRDDPAFRELIAGFPLHRGDPLVHTAYEAAKTQFVTAAMRHGYLDADFTRHELVIDLSRYVGVVVLHYTTGPHYRFGELRFDQDVVNASVLEGYANFKRGDPLDWNRLLELEQKLSNSPYFQPGRGPPAARPRPG